MAWMTDEEYSFVSDSFEKKNIAASAHKMRSHCGKGGRVRLPSDFMTKKELKAMSGECISYRPNHPMSWDEFKKLADDLKVDYITRIRDRFGAPDKYIAEMFGVAGHTLGLYLKDLNLCVGKGANRPNWDKEKFHAWRTGADPDLVNENETEDISEDTAVEESVSEVVEENKDEGSTCAVERICAVPTSGAMDFKCSADLALNAIAQLLGSNKVNLHISWEVITEET